MCPWDGVLEPFPRVQWVAASPVTYIGRLDSALEPFLEHNWYYLLLPNASIVNAG